MSESIADIKKDIKEIKAKLKELTRRQVEEDATAGRSSLIDIYTHQLLHHEVTLRGLQIRARVEKAGHDYDEWWTWAKSLYDIRITTDGPGYRVVSMARDWEEAPSWEFGHEIDCKEKIEQLVGYKMYDRNRGRGSIEDDLKEA